MHTQAPMRPQTHTHTHMRARARARTHVRAHAQPHARVLLMRSQKAVILLPKNPGLCGTQSSVNFEVGDYSTGRWRAYGSTDFFKQSRDPRRFAVADETLPIANLPTCAYLLLSVCLLVPVVPARARVCVCLCVFPCLRAHCVQHHTSPTSAWNIPLHAVMLMPGACTSLSHLTHVLSAIV